MCCTTSVGYNVYCSVAELLLRKGTAVDELGDCVGVAEMVVVVEKVGAGVGVVDALAVTMKSSLEDKGERDDVVDDVPVPEMVVVWESVEVRDCVHGLPYVHTPSLPHVASGPPEYPVSQVTLQVPPK